MGFLEGPIYSLWPTTNYFLIIQLLTQKQTTLHNHPQTVQKLTKIPENQENNCFLRPFPPKHKISF
jgi:hypothetical protein